MIYFVVNNDFHVDNLLNQKESFDEYALCVIRIPYNLKSSNSLSDNSIEVYTPNKKIIEFFNPLLFLKAKRKVNEICFCSDDVVIFLTEYDPINLYVAYLAKKNGARVVLLEEGIATYYNNIFKEHNALSFYAMCKLFYLRFFLGFHFIDSYKGNFLKIKDEYVDELVLYRDVNLDRDINVSVVDSCSEAYMSLDVNKALFLNQPLYESYLTETDYVDIFLDVINSLSEQFDEVFFKFHPRDSEVVKAKLRQILQTKKNVVIVAESLDLSGAVKRYKPLFAVSFFSDALFKLSESGMNMVFLYHLYPKLNNNPVLISLTKVLSEMGYQFSESILCITDNFYDVKVGSKKNLKDMLASN